MKPDRAQTDFQRRHIQLIKITSYQQKFKRPEKKENSMAHTEEKKVTNTYSSWDSPCTGLYTDFRSVTSNIFQELKEILSSKLKETLRLMYQ